MGPLRAFWKIATALGKLRDAIKLHQRIIELHQQAIDAQQETLDQHQRAIDALLSTNADLSASVGILREMVMDLQRG